MDDYNIVYATMNDEGSCLNYLRLNFNGKLYNGCVTTLFIYDYL